MRRSGVAIPRGGSRALSLVNGDSPPQGAIYIVRSLVRPCPWCPPSRWAASHKLRSIMCPYRSIVMAAVACPSTRWTTFGSAPDASHTEAAVWRRS
jgi:hypothetical protein